MVWFMGGELIVWRVLPRERGVMGEPVMDGPRLLMGELRGDGELLPDWRRFPDKDRPEPSLAKYEEAGGVPGLVTSCGEPRPRT